MLVNSYNSQKSSKNLLKKKNLISIAYLQLQIKAKTAHAAKIKERRVINEVLHK